MNKTAHKSKKAVTVVSTNKATSVQGAQNQRLIPTITHSISGATNIGAGFVVMPPAHVAKPHYHAKSELIIFFLEGCGVAFTGRDFTPHFVAAGDFLYVPEGEIHFGINLREDVRHTGVEIRTDQHFNEDLVLVPELNDEAQHIAAEYRRKFAEGTLDVPASWQALPDGPFNFTEPNTVQI